MGAFWPLRPSVFKMIKARATPPNTTAHRRWEAQRLTLLLLPGHTPGSIFIQYQERFLFTGDSLHYSRVDGRLTGFRCVVDAPRFWGGEGRAFVCMMAHPSLLLLCTRRLHCWQDWALQVASWGKLREHKASRTCTCMFSRSFSRWTGSLIDDFSINPIMNES